MTTAVHFPLKKTRLPTHNQPTLPQTTLLWQKMTRIFFNFSRDKARLYNDNDRTVIGLNLIMIASLFFEKGTAQYFLFFWKFYHAVNL